MSSPITGLTELTAGLIANGDLLTVVDISDSTMSPDGTNKKYLFSTLLADLYQISRVVGDQTTSSTSLSDVPGISGVIVMRANATYKIDVIGGYISSATTESMGLSINGSTAAASVMFESAIGASSTVDHNIFVGHAYDAVTPTFTSGAGATERRFGLSAVITNGAAASTLALRYRSETGGANDVTIKSGAVMVATRIA